MVGDSELQRMLSEIQAEQKLNRDLPFPDLSPLNYNVSSSKVLTEQKNNSSIFQVGPRIVKRWNIKHFALASILSFFCKVVQFIYKLTKYGSQMAYALKGISK